MNRFKQIATSVVLFLISHPLFAQDGASAATADSSFLGYIGFGAAIGIGIAAAGAASGQGRAASAALDGIARNPASANKMFVPLLLSLALMESLVIFCFLVTNGLGTTITKALGLG